jgi:signal transduction histidine kinase/methionine-rich copper-binding protein CopC
MRIKPKLFVIILTLVLVALLITSFVSIDAFSHAMIAEIKKRLEDSVVLSMEQISLITSQKVLDAKMIGSFIGRLVQLNQSGSLNEKALEEILGNIDVRESNATSPSFNSIAIFNESGEKIAHKKIGGNNDMVNLERSLAHNSTNEEFFKTAIKGQSFHDNIPWHSSLFDDSVIRVSAPIYDIENDNIYGVLALTYSLEGIFEYIKSISPHASGSGNNNKYDVKKDMGVYLLSQNGTTLYYSTLSETRVPHGKDFYTPLIFGDIKDSDYGVVSGIYPTIVNNTYGGNRDAIFVATKGEIGNSNDSIANTANNNDNNRKENSWFLITSLGTESAFEETSNLRNTFILVTLLVLAGTAIAVFYISRIISKPIMKLKDAAISIARGNLNIQVKPFSSKDEIGELAMQFETMRQNIKKYTDELTEKEKELQQHNVELIANDRAKEEFISMVSHELRTPLAPMKLYSEMLLQPKIMGGLNEKQKRAVEGIYKSILKQEQLVEDILDVFKIDMGHLRLLKQEIDIYQLVSEIVNDLKPFTIEKKIEITYDIKILSIKTVFCDRGRIEQVFANLIKNSVDFVPEGTGKIIVKAQEIQDTISNNDSSNTSNGNTKSNIDTMAIVFSVEDNGIGIPPEDADRSFKKFYQIDTSATRKHGGTGLGLAICKGIVEAHGGKIWIDKNYAGGAAIRFTISRER